MRGRSTSVVVKDFLLSRGAPVQPRADLRGGMVGGGYGAKAAMAATGDRALSGQGALPSPSHVALRSHGKTCPEGNADKNDCGGPVLPVSEHDLHPVNRVYSREPD